MAKFKVGDRVICIIPKDRKKHGDESGAGWVLGMQFNVTQVKTWSGILGNVYLGDGLIGGVFEGWLGFAPADQWKEQVGNNKKAIHLLNQMKEFRKQWQSKK